MEIQNKIEPHYVDFNTAKLLKEKGFDSPVYSYYSGNTFCLNYSIINQYSQEYIENKGECLIIPYTSGEGSLYLESINFNGWGNLNYSAPEQHIVTEWLRVVHGIWVEVNHCGTMNEFAYKICKLNKKNIKTEPHHVSEFGKDWNTPQEAYSAAFDYILKNLI